MKKDSQIPKIILKSDWVRSFFPTFRKFSKSYISGRIDTDINATGWQITIVFFTYIFNCISNGKGNEMRGKETNRWMACNESKRLSQANARNRLKLFMCCLVSTKIYKLSNWVSNTSNLGNVYLPIVPYLYFYSL